MDEKIDEYLYKPTNEEVVQEEDTQVEGDSGDNIATANCCPSPITAPGNTI